MNSDGKNNQRKRNSENHINLCLLNALVWLQFSKAAPKFQFVEQTRQCSPFITHMFGNPAMQEKRLLF